MPPYLSKTPPWFVFLVHPRNTDDLLNFDAGRMLRNYCPDVEDFTRRMCMMPPFVAGEVFFGGTSVKGEIIAVMSMPENMMSRAGREEVSAAAALAKQRGARFLGLGGLTAPATLGGKLLVEGLHPKVVLTNGNAYTAAVVRHNVREAARCLSLGPRAVVAIVGCTGSVGYAASLLLEEEGFRLCLVGRSRAAVLKRFTSLPEGARVTDLVGAMNEADIVVLLTNDPGGSLSPCSARPGTVVIDCAQPANFSPAVRHRLAGAGVIVADGGLVKIPGYECSYDFNMPAPGLTYSCLAETYLFARHGLAEHSVGHADVALSERLDALAERSGITVHPLRLTVDKA